MFLDQKSLHADTDKLLPAAMQQTRTQRNKRVCSGNIKGWAHDYDYPSPTKNTQKHGAV